MKATTLLHCSLLLLTLACGDKIQKRLVPLKHQVSSIYASSELSVKVYYEPEAEPLTGDLIRKDETTLKVWEVLRMNLSALFTGRSLVPMVSVPMDLSEMTKIPKQNHFTWSTLDAVALGREYGVPKNAGQSVFQIFFVNGFYREAGNTLGFHVNGTHTIIIFKDAVRRMGVGEAVKQVEIGTVVHEMGHALGLVNNGIAMNVDHQDRTRGSHCSNPNCIMYYSNEGESTMSGFNFAIDATDAMKSFMMEVMQKDEPILFDHQCLSDARNFKVKPR